MKNFIFFVIMIVGCQNSDYKPTVYVSKPTTVSKLTTEQHLGDDTKQRTELEEKLEQFTDKVDKMEQRLEECQATYKRRTEAGGLDYSTYEEIEKLKKEIPQLWKKLELISKNLADGPPYKTFEDEIPVPKTTPEKKEVNKLPVSKSDPYSDTYYSSNNKVNVSGYTKKNGTYVAPYVRSGHR